MSGPADRAVSCPAVAVSEANAAGRRRVSHQHARRNAGGLEESVDSSALSGRDVGRATLTVAVVVMFAVEALMPFVPSDVSGTAVAFFLSWGLCLALLLSDDGGGLYRPSAGYLVLFGFFHGGLLFSIALRGRDAFTAYDVAWIDDGYAPEATHLAILGMAAFTLAAELASRGARGEPASGPVPIERARLAVAGLGCLLTGVVIFVVAVADAGGFGLVSGGYLMFIQANESDSALGYGTLLVGYGVILAVLAGGRTRVVAWAIFGAYSVVAFLIGSRGSVLFALLAILIVEVRQGRRIRTLWTVGGALGVLVLIGLVRQTRLVGFGQSGGTSVGSPLDALAEMGASLRPTTVVLDWHSFGEPFRHGVTLVAVPVRFLERLTGWHGGAPAHDDRLFNVEISERVSAIGGSPIAEGYHNFGTVGVVLFMLAIGLAIGRIERLPRSPWSTALTGVVLLPLLVQVRNSFAPVPVQLALGLLLLCLVRAGARRHTPQDPGNTSPELTTAR
ncbi:O-antigen polysaccharide polymerase Wzy [Amycolatopsis sp. NPDC051128]|uniref:O-antigen polysaccharide polymerase Wzy n=1 Tax=Amycolatopsis sp. NPDC051128 TaxID=3155412 RepID=UPI00342EF8AF